MKNLAVNFLKHVSENLLHLEVETLQLPQFPNLLLLHTIDETDKNLHSISLAFKNTSQDDLEEIETYKFEILQILENLAFTSLSETANNDACSFTYHFDTQHATDPIITCSITDYFS